MSGTTPPPGAARAPEAPRSPYAAALAGMGVAPATTPAGSRPAAARVPLASQPGGVPLRPMSTGDVLDTALRVLRTAPGATLGAALVVAAVTLVVPVLVVGGLTTVAGAAVGDGLGDGSAESVSRLLGSGTVLVVGQVVSLVGSAYLAGILAHVVHAAAVGELITLDEAWRRLRGRRWALLGLTVLIAVGYALLVGGYLLSVVLLAGTGSVGLTVLYCLLTGPLLLLLLLWTGVRLTGLALVVVALERTGVGRGLGRALALTRRSFWRVLGTWLLAGLVSFVATLLLSAPFTIGAEVAPSAAGEAGEWIAVGLTALGSVAVGALVTPYLAAVVAVQYLDLRIRGEGYDVTLWTQADEGHTGGRR
ncbi:hypothetical protein INN71_03340 [Nocardioides sp. ChNu-153]|uniref:hypothetical protein n=1 Tax=Nocardioides sp. ChNu-153 TaxID=2779364 RepID=UPI00264E7387|nr:hypothetical protein [Nocardioides sp. ChNu-153]MDN7120421.1 hypothetical protein [Nocardioides sp. ChNu-153]